MGSPPCAIFRYPDELRNIVQQCANTNTHFHPLYRGYGARYGSVRITARNAVGAKLLLAVQLPERIGATDHQEEIGHFDFTFLFR